jgi:hypothetical protein
LPILDEALPGTGTLVADRVSQVSGEGLLRALLAPETTTRILWPRRYVRQEIATFLADAFTAEAALEGRVVPPLSGLWSARGDAHISGDRSVERTETVGGRIPVDLESPFSRSIDVTGEKERLEKSRPPLAELEREVVLKKLRAAICILAAHAGPCLDVVARFTKVLVVLADPAEPFSSGSVGRYIGRTVICNVQAAPIDAGILADALLHESIHALLYIQEIEHAWVTDSALLLPERRVASPWTDRLLSVRSFLQACFVWYGLLHFWSQLRTSGATPPDIAERMMSRAIRGFRRRALLAPLQDAGIATDAIEREVRDAILLMQARVSDALAGA